MKQNRLALIIAGLALASTPAVRAQVTTTSSTDGLALANALASGSGLTITSATYSGGNGAAGFFSGATGLLPFSSGIALTSGLLSNIPGPNNTTGVSYGWGLPGDPDLTLSSGQNTNDAATLIIHFTTTANVISFQYAFGSEEYPEFVGSFNDSFGFFLNGVNIATLPGTNTPVSIDTINPNLNSSYYFNNNFQNGTAPLNLQYDGFVGISIPLFATAAVTPNVDNVIKIVVADGGDTALDTGIFLAANSFIAAPPPTPTPVLTAVPEPSTYGAGASLALLAFAGFRRMRQRKPIAA